MKKHLFGKPLKSLRIFELKYHIMRLEGQNNPSMHNWSKNELVNYLKEILGGDEK